MKHRQKSHFLNTLAVFIELYSGDEVAVRVQYAVHLRTLLEPCRVSVAEPAELFGCRYVNKNGDHMT